MDIKVFGERNTATNALIKVIETNSDTRCIPGTASDIDPAALRRARKREFSTWLKERTLDGVFRGVPDPMSWKHAATNFADAGAFRDTHVIFTVRHPASWLLGLYRKPYHILSARPDSFAEFIRMSWKTVARERLGRSKMALSDLYETKLRSYDDFAAKLADVGASHSFVRFEDFVVSQQDCFDPLRPLLNNPVAEFKELASSTKERSKDVEYYRDYYGNERWRDELEGQQAAIDQMFDWSKWARFGYGPSR